MSEFSYMDGGHDASGAMAGSEAMGSGPSSTAAWNPGFKGVKFSDMVQGINVTPNFMLAMLFLGLTAWLFVIYWIRHNEPLANQVLGTPKATAPTASADRMIVEGAKHALPIRTSTASGSFYTPDKKLRSDKNFSKESGAFAHAAQPYAAHTASAPAKFGGPTTMNGRPVWGVHGAPPVSALHHPINQADAHARVLKSGREHVVVPHPEPMLMAPGAHNSPYARHHAGAPAPLTSPYGAGHGGHYHLPVTTRDLGTRLKTVVHR